MAAGKGVLRSPSAENRGWLRELEQSQGGKPVLLEHRNPPGSTAAVGGGDQEEASAELALWTPPGKLRLGKPLGQKVRWDQGRSAFMEVPQLKKRLQGRWAEDRERDGLPGQPGPQQLTQDIPREPPGSTVFSAWPSRAGREQRSAFSKPARCLSETPGATSLFQAGSLADALGELLGLIEMVDIPWARLSNSKILVSDFWNLQMLPQNAPLCNAFLSAPTLWLKHAMAQIPTVSSAAISWALLPPTVTSLGLSTQNCCAKCNLTFRLTSDLVFHMRSHHRKANTGPDLQSKKPRGEALTCPICCEDFRERHHLSRHLASHR